jgi:tetratricopeptide (TPR) repeat protein
MKYCLILLLALQPITAGAQKRAQALIDSLLTELPKAKEDTAKVNLLDLLSFTYSTIDATAGIKWGQQALALAEKLQWQRGIAVAHADLGANYENLSNNDSALMHDFKALKIYETLGRNRSVAAVLSNIALVYLAQSNYAKALEYDFRALKIDEDMGDKRNGAVALENIGSAYFEQKNYSKTKEYYTAALKQYTQVHDTEGMARCLGNIGIVLDAAGDYTNALRYHRSALKASEAAGNRDAMQLNLENIGYVYSHSRNYNMAISYQLRALKMSEALQDKKNTAIDLGNLGETYFAMATDTVLQAGTDKAMYLKQSAKYLEQAIDLCKETGFSAPLMEFNQYLSDAYYLAGEHKKAFERLKEYTAVRDSVFSLQNKVHIANLEADRENELSKKDLLIKDRQLQIKNLQLAKKQNENILYIISTVLLLLITFLVLLGLYNYRRSNRRLMREKRRHLAIIREQVNHIKAQADTLEVIAHMQAHDIRGPVATILGLAQLFNFNDLTDPTNAVVIKGITDVTGQLDTAVQEVIRKKQE